VSLDWTAVQARYADHPKLPSLRGTTSVQVTDIDDERICLRQRLWRDCVLRDVLETALAMLEAGELDPEPLAFSEGMRRYYASGPQVRTDCTRGPNLTAVVLADLGYLTSR
jgi:hypothetical protein